MGSELGINTRPITCELLDYMGSDLTVVNAARVSMNKESKELSSKDIRLLNYLARNRHWTPFAHCIVQVRETVPIFVARQRFRHTVGFVYNEVSRRYVDDEIEFFAPAGWRKRAESVKQGSSDEFITEAVFDDTSYEMPVELTADQRYTILLQQSLSAYDDLLRGGVAPEQARMVLPSGLMTSYIVTGSLAAFHRAYEERTGEHAQAEIKELASHWGSIMETLFPMAWKALVTHGHDQTNKEESKT